jgi:hypothetical protein
VVNVCTTSSALLFITDRISKHSFLMDMGYELCVSQVSSGRSAGSEQTKGCTLPMGPPSPHIDGSHGAINLGLRRDFTWRFVLADVKLTIIGVDLLSDYGLLVDCRNNCLFDGVTSLSTPGLIAPTSVPTLKVNAGGRPQTAAWRNSRS